MTHRYAPSADVLASHLDEETVLLHLGSKRYHRLNATSAAIWRTLEKEASSAKMLGDRLAAEFDVASDQAESEARRHLQDLLERELIVAVESGA